MAGKGGFPVRIVALLVLLAAAGAGFYVMRGYEPPMPVEQIVNEGHLHGLTLEAARAKLNGSEPVPGSEEGEYIIATNDPAYPRVRVVVRGGRETGKVVQSDFKVK